MRIESTAIALRRREPWEAIDLGFAMLRQWWRPVYAAWAVTFVPVAGVLIVRVPRRARDRRPPACGG